MTDPAVDPQAQKIKDLEALIAAQRREIRNMQVVAERKNLELDALHFVWCSGQCGKPLSKEIVEEAIRNTDRLILKFNGQRSSRAWRLLSEYPDDQKALLYSWGHYRAMVDREQKAIKRAEEAEAKLSALIGPS